MTINIRTTIETVSNRDLQKVMYHKDLIAALARQIVAGQVEAHIDIMSDCAGEYTNFSAAEGCIQWAKEIAAENFDELVQEFRDAVLDEIKKVNITVTAVKFTKDGAEDADVSVD